MEKFILCLALLSSARALAAPLFDCGRLLERLIAPFSRESSQPVYVSAKTSARAKELNQLGFKRFANSDFYQRGPFTVELVDGKTPRFWKNYSNMTASSIVSIARSNVGSSFALAMLGSDRGRSLFELNTMNGSGRSGGTYQPVHNPADKTIREQLARAGFESLPNNSQILTLKTEEGSSVVALLSSHGKLLSLLKPLESETFTFMDENTSFVGFRVKPAQYSFLSPESILALETSYLRFEMGHDGQIVYGSQIPKRDFGSLTDEQLGVRSVVTKRVDAGFVIGGRNQSEAILQLKTLNGIAISELENIMRPEASSQEGFLGEGESLLTVLAQDNRFVVNEMGTTHQEIARQLKRFKALYGMGFAQGAEFSYQGRRFVIRNSSTRGWQDSPFNDNTSSGADFEITNLDNQMSIQGGWLVAEMIERYGFYEGQGTDYRLDPKKILEVFDFIRPTPSPAP